MEGGEWKMIQPFNHARISLDFDLKYFEMCLAYPLSAFPNPGHKKSNWVWMHILDSAEIRMHV